MAERWIATERARADLRDIWFFGAERWSPKQADTYLRALVQTFDLLADQPMLARERREIAEGVRSHPQGTHIILFRVDPKGIEVLRVVHQRSNWSAYLDT